MIHTARNFRGSGAAYHLGKQRISMLSKVTAGMKFIQNLLLLLPGNCQLIMLIVTSNLKQVDKRLGHPAILNRLNLLELIAVTINRLADPLRKGIQNR